MITELGKRCQEMARIEDFVSFNSELLTQCFLSPLGLAIISGFATFKHTHTHTHTHTQRARERER